MNVLNSALRLLLVAAVCAGSAGLGVAAAGEPPPAGSPSSAPSAAPSSEPSPSPTSAPTDAAASVPAPAASVPGCLLAATLPFEADTPLYDEPTDGAVVAKFTGAPIAVRVGPLAGDPTKGRVRLATAGDTPGLRLEGWVPWSAIDTYAAHDLPLADRHVWITSGQPLRVAGAGPNSLTVEYAVPGSRGQSASATVPCSGVSLLPRTVEPVAVPATARTYQMRTSTLELFDGPDGRVVFTLQMQDEARQVFWSSSTRGGFVQLLTRGGLTITAWARAADLVALRRGEAIMQDVPKVWPRQPRGLTLENGPAPVTVHVDLPIRPAADGAARLIGVLEGGTSVFPMERRAGWVNVLPIGLGIMPPDGGGFWISSRAVR